MQALTQLAHARELQRHLLPRHEQFAGEGMGCEIGIYFRPDGWVSGDYVDVLPMTGGQTFFCAADVCGKGLSAAMLATALRSAVRCLLADGMDLSEVMERLNDHLCQSLPPASFVTMFAAMVHHGTGEVWYVNAGHPPAWVLREDGRRRLFGENGHPPLGIDRMAMSERHERLRNDELLVLYTDGCVDRAGSDGQPLGARGLAELLQPLAGGTHASLQDAIDVLEEQFVQVQSSGHVPGVLHDDSTMLLLRLRDNRTRGSAKVPSRQ